MSRLRIGTRGSRLALVQAQWAASLLPGSEIVTVTTAGDLNRAAGDKSRWVGALEQALLGGSVDVAVHSAKDVPGDLAEGCALAAASPRADARDALVGAASLAALPPGARVGTSAVRRRAQLLAARSDLEVVELRGNVDTRLRKLAAGEVDALVLAYAGLERLGVLAGGGVSAEAPRPTGEVALPDTDPPRSAPVIPLDGDLFVPAPGQGTLAVEARAGEEAAVSGLNDAPAFACLRAERAVVNALDATCHTPVGAHASLTDGGRLAMAAFVGLPDGSAWLRDDLEGDAADPAALGEAVAERLLAAGADDLLAQATALAQR